MRDLTTDANGTTEATMRIQTKEIADNTVHAYGWGLTLGRLWTSKRRFVWAERFQWRVASVELSDGTRFEPVVAYPTKKATVDV